MEANNYNCESFAFKERLRVLHKNAYHKHLINSLVGTLFTLSILPFAVAVTEGSRFCQKGKGRARGFRYRGQ